MEGIQNDCNEDNAIQGFFVEGSWELLNEPDQVREATKYLEI